MILVRKQYDKKALVMIFQNLYIFSSLSKSTNKFNAHFALFNYVFILKKLSFCSIAMKNYQLKNSLNLKKNNIKKIV